MAAAPCMKQAEHEMDQIRVILAEPFTSPSFAAGLRVLLAETGRFDLVENEGAAPLDDLLGDDRPTALILESADPTESIGLLESSRNLSVVQVDPVGARAFVGLDNPGWSGLLRLIDAAADPNRAVHGVHVQSRLRVVKPDERTPAAERRSTGDDVGPIREWLDLMLGLGLVHRRGGAEHGSIPGWSLTPEESLSSLGIAADASENELEEQLRAADHRLMVDRAGLPASLVVLAETFDLDDRECRILGLTLAPEIDGRYGAAIGVLSDDLSSRRPSLTLLAELLDVAGDGWELRKDLARAGSLLDRQLLIANPTSPERTAVEVGYRPQLGIVAAMLSDDPDDAARAVGAEFVRVDPIEPAPTERALAGQLAREAGVLDRPYLIELAGPGESRWFERLAAAGEIPLLRGDLRLLDGRAAHLATGDWLTVALLSGSALMVVGLETLDRGQARLVAATLSDAPTGVPFVAVAGPVNELIGERTSAIRLDPPEIPDLERAELWLAMAGRAGLALSDDDAHSLSVELRLDPSEIAACIDRCSNRVTSTPTTFGEAAGGDALIRRLRQEAGWMRQRDLPPAVQRIETVFEWDDLVLADDVKAVLRSIPDHVTHSGRVLTSWGFSSRLPYGRGVATLFSGPSGTGKTMAARIIAADLGRDLLHVDLSKTISKYIGETEKNIDGVFDAAERRGAVLLFDEADALFGKRSEVKDAHDRHANVEVAYLLQRLEAYTGVAVLTSNLKQNIDEAFLRRLRFVVDFPLPGADERRAIWRRSFPAEAPLADDVDLAFLARRLKLTGGTIQQIALHAAFAAATNGDPIRMQHVVAATRRELLKLGMLNMGKALEEQAA